MTQWNGSGYESELTLTDDEVLTLIRSTQIKIDEQSPDLVPAMIVWRKLQQRAEDILNAERAERYSKKGKANGIQ